MTAVSELAKTVRQVCIGTPLHQSETRSRLMEVALILDLLESPPQDPAVEARLLGKVNSPDPKAASVVEAEASTTWIEASDGATEGPGLPPIALHIADEEFE